MEKWSEVEWREAEARRPGKTYVTPKKAPFLKSAAGQLAIVCIVLAVLLVALWAVTT